MVVGFQGSIFNESIHFYALANFAGFSRSLEIDDFNVEIVAW